MPRTRIAAGWMTTILMLASVACDTGSAFEPGTERSEVSLAESRVEGDQGTEAIELKALRRTTPFMQDYTVTREIGPLGGVIAGGGVQLVIPAGALRERTEITMTVPAGNYLDVRFAPHGLVFDVPAYLSLTLTGTEAAGNPGLLAELIGVYHNDDAEDGTLLAEEVFGLRINGTRATFPIEHFSSYTLGYRGFILVGA